MSKTIKQILIQRDNFTAEEADEEIKEAKAQLHRYLAENDHASAYDICEEFFGLEPDYLFELL